MHLRRQHFIALAVLAFAAVLIAVVRRGEPQHHGKTLSHWIEEARHTDYPDELPPSIREAEQAIRDIGPRALPTLVRMVSATNPGWKGLLADLLEKQRFFNPEFHWAGEQHERALAAFQILGTNARPAIPRLADLLVRPDTARPAALALAFIGPETLPVLQPALTNVDLNVRHGAIDGVFALGSNAVAAVPALVPLLHDPDPVMASGAISIIAAVAPVEVSLPLLIEGLNDLRLQRNAVAWIGVLGTNAVPAVPRLRSLLNDPNPMLRSVVTNALKQIEQTRHTTNG